jgi:MEMO1 family protein
LILKRTFIFIAFCLLLVPHSAGCSENIKEPSVAGTFYPSDKDELAKTVDDLLSKAQKSSPDGRLVAMISPHAGYRYSGQVAAYGYSEIKDSSIQKVFLIGPSHHAVFRGASVYLKGKFRTPLGDVEINEKLAKELLSETADIRFDPGAFDKEHSLEVQLPFLQTVLKDFTIVPVLVGSPTKDTIEHLIIKLAGMIDEKTLIIASTDLSHYHGYSKAVEMDSRIISAIERLSLSDAGQLLRTGDSELCGIYPVVITMEAARRSGANTGILFNYANSGDTAGGKDRVVGYASIGLYKNPLTPVEKNELLILAKDTIREYVINRKVPETGSVNPKFRADESVFVTVKKNGGLRGCIGNTQPVMSLYEAVIKNAIAASSGDPRFPPLTEEELKDIDVEISILSPLTPVKNAGEIKVGKHGLVIRKGMQSGLLLPQVATEFGWDRETLLEQLCVKAGLPKGSWKEADLYTFTAEIIKDTK